MSSKYSYNNTSAVSFFVMHTGSDLLGVVFVTYIYWLSVLGFNFQATNVILQIVALQKQARWGTCLSGAHCSEYIYITRKRWETWGEDVKHNEPYTSFYNSMKLKNNYLEIWFNQVLDIFHVTFTVLIICSIPLHSYSHPQGLYLVKC